MTDAPDDVDRLDAALSRLVSRAVVTPEQADAVRTEFAALPPSVAPRPPAPDDDTPNTSLLAEIAGYTGAVFVIAGAAALAAAAWGSLARPAQFGILLAAAVLVTGAALATAHGRTAAESSGPRNRLVAVLLLLAAGLYSGATAVYATGRVAEHLIPVPALAVAFAGYTWRRGVLLNLGLATATATTAAVLVDLSRPSTGIPVGLTLAFVGAAWLAASVGRVVLTEESAGWIAGGLIAFVGAELVTTSGGGGASALGYLLLFALGIAGGASYLATRGLAALAVGGLTLAIAVPQLVLDLTDGALGAALALLIGGLLIVALSVVALRRVETPAT
ncbi:DUF2157 domain-containing protein [Spongisporangium articulatum]|uniref:DUF2157 domain-containing protein n=1 Tax=Spongisporangium articulatum TaxID=3362603 RepID=A0ABW8AH68_9ACTN